MKLIKNVMHIIIGLFKKIFQLIKKGRVGRIILYTILAILVLILLFILVQGIAYSLGPLLGFGKENIVGTATSDAAFLNSLSNSGYEELMSARDLKDYYNFEYATLMDCARYMEETGTYKIKKDDQDTVHCREVVKPRWGELVAASFCGGTVGGSVDDNEGVEESATEPGDASEEEETAATAEEGPTTEATSGDLWYLRVRNEHTNTTSLVPYLILDRTDDDLCYFFEVKGDFSSEYKTGGKSVLATTKNIYANMGSQQVRFNSGIVPGSVDRAASAAWINENVEPSKYNSELNVSNKAAFKDTDAGYSAGGQLTNDDLMIKHSEGAMYYTTDSQSVQFRIPLRSLLERYLPNAALFAAWRHLTDSDSKTGTLGYNASDDVINNIYKFYSSACLNGEINENGKRYLLKYVSTITFSGEKPFDPDEAYPLGFMENGVDRVYHRFDDDDNERYSGDVKVAELFSMPLNSLDAIDGLSEHPTKYGMYLSQHNTTRLSENPEEFDNNFKNRTATLKDYYYYDILEDLRLAQAYYVRDYLLNSGEKYHVYTGTRERAWYGGDTIDQAYQYKIGSCSGELREFYDGLETEDGVYTTGFEGGYRALDPVTDNNGQLVFKIAVKFDPSTGTKRTAVLFRRVTDLGHRWGGQYNNKKYIEKVPKYVGYVISEQKYTDVSQITNNNTFVKFETETLKSTTFREWRFSGTAESKLSNENWFVTDAHEVLEADISSITVKFTPVYVKDDGSIVHGDEITLENFSQEQINNILHSHGYDDGNGNAYKASDIKNEIASSITGRTIVDNDDNKKYYAEYDNAGVAIRRHDIDSSDHTAHDYTRAPTDPEAIKAGVTTCLDKSPNAVVCEADGGFWQNGDHTTSTGASYGEAVAPQNYIELNMRTLGVNPRAPFHTNNTVELETINSICMNDNGFMQLEMVRDSIPPYTYTTESTVTEDGSIIAGSSEHSIEANGITNLHIIHNIKINYGVFMPVRVAVSMISQRVVDKTLPHGYFVKEADYWAAHMEFNNELVVNGEFLFEDRDKIGFLIPNNNSAVGIKDIRSDYKTVYWRCKWLAPIFGGKNDSDSGREADIDLIMSEWETIAEGGDGTSGAGSADHFIRDLNYLIQYSRGLLSGDYIGGFQPTKDPSTNTPYVNHDSYTYMYLPEEITKFNPLTSEKIFWLDRIISTTEDAPTDESESKLRSRATTFTWQVVEYDKYDETRRGDTQAVYAMWPYGDQLSRLLYAIASNVNEKENKKVTGWGGYSGVHKAADLYGRTTATKIFNAIYGAPDPYGKDKVVFNDYYGYAYTKYSNKIGSAKIYAEMDGDNVTLRSYLGNIEEGAEPEEDVSGDNYVLSAGADGLYFKNSPVTMELGGNTYTFPGAASAAYGYELYRTVLANESADRGMREMKDRLEKEMEWTEVRAAAPGIVEEVTGDASSGFRVLIRHSDNPRVTTSYCHMKRYPLVQKDQYVGEGTVLGYEGTTGKSLGYHLHTTYNISGRAMSPVRYLYPFFSPFYYNELALSQKLDSNTSNSQNFLGSEYWTTTRIVFPYGQIIDNVVKERMDNYGTSTGEEPNSTNPPIKTAQYESSDGNNIVKVANYVPEYPLLEDYRNLEKERSGDFLDLIPHDPATIYPNEEAGSRSSYTGDLVTANVYYSFEPFIDAALRNGIGEQAKISGVIETFVDPGSVSSAGDAEGDTEPADEPAS